MVRRGAGVVQRQRFESKAALLAAGSWVAALTYERASQDRKEQGKSVGDQRRLNVAEVERHGWRLEASFVDNDRSASRHARGGGRPDFERLMEAITAGKGDVLVVWEISRNQRDLAVYVQIRDLCTRVGLFFWLVGGVLYDLRDRNDRMMLGFQAVQAEFMADYIRDNVLRGQAGAAEAGRPHGKVTYGYRRVYDPRTKAFLRQEHDTEKRQAVGEDGSESTYTHAGLVKEIFGKVVGGVPLIKIEDELNARGIPSPQGRRWLRSTVRKIAMNPAYIGKRVYRGEVVGDGVWPPLIDEETYWACVRLLQDPSRKTTRPGRAVHLLSYIVRCGVCQGPVRMTTMPRAGSALRMYACLRRRCASVKAELLDEFVERTVVAWLSREDVFQQLVAAGHNDAEATHARTEAERLSAELEDYKKLAETGELKAVDYVRFERSLTARIQEAEAKAKESGIPPVLRGRIGPQAIAAWDAIADDLAVKREIIRTVADIELLPAAHKGERRPFGRHRLNWTWLLAKTCPR
jgi:site-specific DNA recombinase